MALFDASNGTLFGELPPPYPTLDRGKLSALVKATHTWNKGTAGIQAGYTYFGQFLAHELIRRPVGGVNPPIERSCLLDLDSLYGVSGWQDSAVQMNNAGEFIIGHTTAVGRHPSDRYLEPAKRRDLIRSNKIALIPEPRNDDNLFISQLHLLFQKFHNKIINSLRQHPNYQTLNSKELYTLSKQYVIYVIQEITLEDYLRNIVYNELFYPLILSSNILSVPLSEHNLPTEFTSAAMRFGHSQILDKYKINPILGVNRIGLEEILYLTGKGGLRTGPNDSNDFPTLRADRFVDWTFLFKPPGKAVQSGNLIDPHIAISMRKLLEDEPTDISPRNFKAGHRSKISSGQEIVRQIKAVMDPDLFFKFMFFESLDSMELSEEEKDILDLDPKYYENTPLWLYLLLEAKKHPEVTGSHLGPLGSIIVMDILCSTIRNQRQIGPTINPRDLQTIEEVSGKITKMYQLISLTEKED